MGDRLGTPCNADISLFFLFLYLLILHQSTDQPFLSWHISLITNLNNVDDYLDFCQTRHTFYVGQKCIFYFRFDLEKTLHWVPMSYSKVSLGFSDVYYCWATPRRTAILGRSVARAEQAQYTSPPSKNQFNIVVAWSHVSDIKLIRTDTTL